MFEYKNRIFHFHKQPSKKDISELKKHGFEIVSINKILKMIIAKPPKKTLKFPILRFLINRIKKLRKNINWVGKDFKVKATLNVVTKQIGAENVWMSTPENTKMGNGVKICINDSGVDEMHPDIKNNLVEKKDFTKSSCKDYCGHGSHCSSIALGTGEASNKIYRGAAPKASLYIAKTLGDDGCGMASWIIEGLEWACEQKVNIISMSLGGPAQKGGDALSHAVDHIVKEHGICVVAAAGNSGKSIDTPGCSSYAITVGACDKKYKIAKFSGRGPTKDGLDKPDIVAPGVYIIAARSKYSNLEPLKEIVDESLAVEYYKENLSYTEMSGTSMSTPLVAGVIALILAETPLKPEQIKKLIMDTATSLPGYTKYEQGAGLLNIEKAYQERSKYIEPEE
jgi:subtilisin family serine protease